MFVFFKHCTYIAKGRIRNIPQAQTKRYRQTSTYSNNNKQTNNNPDPSSPVELLLVRTTRKKTLEKSSNQYGMKVPTRNAKDQIIGQIPMKHPGLDEQNPDQFTI